MYLREGVSRILLESLGSVLRLVGRLQREIKRMVMYECVDYIAEWWMVNVKRGSVKWEKDCAVEGDGRSVVRHKSWWKGRTSKMIKIR